MYWFLLNLPLMIVGCIIAIGPIAYQMVQEAKHPEPLASSTGFGDFSPRLPSEQGQSEKTKELSTAQR